MLHHRHCDVRVTDVKHFEPWVVQRKRNEKETKNLNYIVTQQKHEEWNFGKWVGEGVQYIKMLQKQPL